MEILCAFITHSNGFFQAFHDSQFSSFVPFEVTSHHFAVETQLSRPQGRKVIRIPSEQTYKESLALCRQVREGKAFQA